LARLAWQLVDSPQFPKAVEQLFVSILRLLFALSPRAILQPAAVNEIVDLAEILGKEITGAAARLGAAVRRRRSELLLKAAETVDLLASVAVLETPVKDFFRYAPPQAVAGAAVRLFDDLRALPIVEETASLAASAVVRHLRLLALDDLIDRELLTADLAAALARLAADGALSADISGRLGNWLKARAGEIIDLAPPEFKSAVLADMLIGALLDGLADHLVPLLDALRFREVAIRQIGEMSPAEIHRLFNAFGSSYFRKVEVYGAPLGAIFGLAGDLAMRLLGG